MYLPLVFFIVFFIGMMVVVSVMAKHASNGGPLGQMIPAGVGKLFGFEREAIDINGRQVFVRYSPATRKHPSNMTASFKGDFFAHAVFRKEQAVDRFGKGVGINAEIQLNDQRLDSMVYIECDDEIFISRLLGSREAKDHLENILKTADSLAINGSSCVMSKQPCDDPAYMYSEAVRLSAVSMLALADNIPLPEPGQRSSTPLTDAGARNTGLFTAFAALILLMGFGLVIWGMALYTPLFPGKIFQKALPLMVPAAGILGFFFVTAVRGRSTSLNVLLMILFMSVLGIGLSCFGGALVFNGSADRSRPMRHEVSIIHKYTTHSKNGHTYHIQTSSWRDDLSYYEFNVARETYNAWSVGTPCLVTTLGGALGVPWVAGRSCAQKQGLLNQRGG